MNQYCGEYIMSSLLLTTIENAFFRNIYNLAFGIKLIFGHILKSRHLTLTMFELCLDDEPALYSYGYA